MKTELNYGELENCSITEAESLDILDESFEEGLDRLMEELNHKQDYLIDKYINSDDHNTDYFFEELSYYQDLSINILSMMIKLRNQDSKS